MVWPERHNALAAHGAKPGMGGGVAIEHGYQGGVGGQGGEQGLDMGLCFDTLPSLALRGAPSCIEPVGAGYGEQPGAGHILLHDLEGFFSFGGHGALIGQRQCRAWCGGNNPMCAGENMFGVEAACGLGQGEVRKPQPHGGAIGALHMFKGVAQDQVQLIAISGFKGEELVLHNAEQWGVGGLVLAAFRSQAQAGGC